MLNISILQDALTDINFDSDLNIDYILYRIEEAISFYIRRVDKQRT